LCSLNFLEFISRILIFVTLLFNWPVFYFFEVLQDALDPLKPSLIKRMELIPSRNETCFAHQYSLPIICYFSNRHRLERAIRKSLCKQDVRCIPVSYVNYQDSAHGRNCVMLCCLIPPLNASIEWCCSP
jgi:hypothetical protein